MCCFLNTLVFVFESIIIPLNFYERINFNYQLEDESIILWDVKTGQQKAELKGHQGSVASVCFSPDGTTLASGSLDSTILLWDVKTEQQDDQLDGHTNFVQSACSPDRTNLASKSRENSIRLWNVKTGQSIKPTDKGYKDIIKQLPFQQNQLEKVMNYPKIIFSSQSTLYAQGALILKGEFLNHQGYDLKPLLKIKGGQFLENNLEKLQKKN